MLIAEDLLLLAVDDESGKTVNVDNLNARLAGALLADLANANRILTQGGPEAGATKEERKEAADAKILITNPDPTGNKALDAALEAAKGEERRAQKVVERIAENAEENLLDGLVERGILEKEETKLFRMLPQTRWPAADSSHENELRVTLKKVLVEGAEPDERTATLISLLHGSGLVANVVGKEDRKAAEARAEEIAGSEWGAASVAAQVAVAASIAAVAAVGAVAAALIIAAAKENEESSEPAEATSQA
ncbi:GOLPH3/VPS74 family protein [Myceligenerans pegani]|uniref:GPP34 family phosphoprotein n=1 Tax=Myceligenerans pegani TaxID=2776917 RepID=A0ABR9N3H8_9MICO|nr:GPP34 family phosphoprotein [Myceligenerans sp. TRM 65318]MBE1878223.1 GPP34 family phosphoprotein [Myceligenerans sp. TRM 65318]MBE3020494.1 GPP34 family phosphoprotein [Myceligenerans sp. TRM 65318]